jgi:hypothetical protein
MLPRELRDEESGNLGGIRERLVVQGGQARDYRHRLLGADVELRVLAAQMRRHRVGVLGLVVVLLVKPDGEGLDWPTGLRPHQGHHRGGVHPTGKKRTQGHIGEHLAADGLAQQTIQRLDRLGIAAGEGVRLTVPHGLVHRPIGLRRGQGTRLGIALAEMQIGARRQLANATVNAEGPGDIVVTQIERERTAVDFTHKGGVRPQRLELRPKEEHATLPAVIERLFSHAVARKGQGAGLPVPQGQREHPHRLLQRGLDPPHLDGCQQCFGIRMAAPVRAPHLVPGAAAARPGDCKSLH